jgi:hypothetical protein
MTASIKSYRAIRFFTRLVLLPQQSVQNNFGEARPPQGRSRSAVKTNNLVAGPRLP